jgi:hypothetical protein
MTTTVREITLKVNRQSWGGSLNNMGRSVTRHISLDPYMEHKSDENRKVLQWVAVLMEPEEGKAP